MVTISQERQQLSDRVKLEKEELLSALPQLDTERIRFLLDVFKETEGEPTIIRRAKFFHRLCTQKTIFIDNNPLAGTLTRFKYGGYPFPEVGCQWMERSNEFSLQRGKAPIPPEAKETIKQAVDYWRKTNIYNRTRDVVLQGLGVDINLLGKCGVGTEFTAGGFMGAFPDYAMVLTKGLKGIKTDIEIYKSRIVLGDPDSLDKWYFYEATLLCLDGFSKLAGRYASLSREMAAKEANPERKTELQRMAESCDWVPDNPPRDFREALQAVWFTGVGIWLEGPMILNAPPCRFPQYMYPFYKKDKERGIITDEEVIELLHFYFLKLNSLAAVLPPHGFAWSQSRIGQQLTLGGLTAEGEDATNELDFLVLEAQKRIRLPEPLVNLVYHDKLSEEFLHRCVDLIRTGVGQPAFHNVRVATESHLLYHKMTLEEARNIGIVGCVQGIIPGYEDGVWEARLNMAKIVELALNDGKDPVTGIQISVKTGTADAFKTYGNFHQAVMKQLEYIVPLARQISRISWNIQRDFPLPFTSTLVHDCLEVGKNLTEGGARYPFGDGVNTVGLIDLANSIGAVKKLVFEDKKVTMKQLREALAANFEGYEDVQKLCLNAPKFGNDDEYVDSIVKELTAKFYKEHQRWPDYNDRPVRPSAYSVTAHFALGRYTGALPNGRFSGKALCDATVSAQPGTDKNGPTALIRSAAGAVDTVKYGNNHLNMKFHPASLAGAVGARNLLSLIKTYFDLGGYHVQFNCVSAEALKEAQKHPEKHRDLIVRVAGFSAFFITLDKGVQDEIIARSELTFRK